MQNSNFLSDFRCMCSNSPSHDVNESRCFEFHWHECGLVLALVLRCYRLNNFAHTHTHESLNVFLILIKECTSILLFKINVFGVQIKEKNQSNDPFSLDYSQFRWRKTKTDHSFILPAIPKFATKKRASISSFFLFFLAALLSVFIFVMNCMNRLTKTLSTVYR